MNGGVYNAELWNPATGHWKTLAAEQVTRQYHSSALLLADGRVLSSGGGICDDCDDVGYLGKNAQIFTPPYLFKKDGSGELAPRPEISAAPSAVPYGAAFQVTTPDAASIRKVGLIRLGSVTHSVNMEQRYVPLSFNAGSGELTATVPARTPTWPLRASTCSSSSTTPAFPRWRRWCRSARRAAPASAASAAAEQSADDHARPADERRDASPRRRP